ncbi:hypothetical protein B0A55_06661 [Friedmanniomyces simplex]|uniref:Trafficking protein particle complex II-specific subunit 65 IgD3 domain-containing protein n=1 Tax=Friedmanniomyces simplex TaxID=329884 RepID=A0A4U0X8X9_9PEZI|nr:hypothetical protein B0A55_06661 [Friedmanniomyces simplex]
MAQDDADARSRFEALSKGAYLDVLLPKSSDFNASALIRDGSPEELARAPSRRNLFFDEKANIVLVLRTAAEVDTRQRCLCLCLRKHDLSAKTLAAADDVEVLAAGDQTYVIWTTNLDLARPRTRLQRPAIYFTATLGLRENARADLGKIDKDYLKPFEPLPRNVLESLNSASDFRSAQVYMSEDRITRVAPKPVRREETVRPIRGATKRAFPTMPALFTRVRYTTVPNGAIASLHLETSQVITGTVSVQHIDVKLSGLDAEPANAVAEDHVLRGLKPDPALTTKNVQCLTEASLPMSLKAGDESVLLYLLPRDQQGRDSSNAVTLDLAVPAGDPAVNSRDTLRMVTSRSRSGSTDVLLSGPSLPAPIPQSGPTPTSRPSGDGVTFFFSAPEKTHQYDDFHLKINCINRSGRSRLFAVVPVRPKQSSLAAHSHSGSDDADLVAGIFNAQPLQRQKPDEVLCHTPHVKVGPVPSGASFDTAMELRAMRVGVLDLGALKIEDLETGQTVDVVDLPDVIALEALEGSEPYGPSKFAVRLEGGQRGRSTAAAQIASPEIDAQFWGKAPTTK